MQTKQVDYFVNLGVKALLAVGAYKYVVRPYLKNLEVNQDKNNREKRAKKYTYTVVIKSGPNKGKRLTFNLDTVAGVIYDSFHGNPITEDEERAIQAIGPVPVDLIITLASVYKELYEKELKQDFVKYLSSKQWNRVAFKFSKT